MTRRLLLLGALALLAGCAKFPAGAAATNDTRLIFSMTVAGAVRSDYVYIVALRTSEDPNPDSPGPTPVVTYPSANGFVAGQATHYVRWDPLQSRAYILYRFSDTGLTAWREVGIPITQIDVAGDGAKKLGFELSTRQLADTVEGAGRLQSVQVNFLTMNKTAQQSGTGRVIDALGDTRLASEVNQFVRIPLTTSGIYDNARFNDLEPTGDTPDPDLDIADWSIEIRRP